MMSKLNMLFKYALGRKTKQGFYKKDKETKARLVDHVEKTRLCNPASQLQLPILSQFNKKT